MGMKEGESNQALRSQLSSLPIGTEPEVAARRTLDRGPDKQRAIEKSVDAGRKAQRTIYLFKFVCFLLLVGFRLKKTARAVSKRVLRP